MSKRSIRVYQPIEHRSIELKVDDIVDIVPSFWEGCKCLVLKDYIRYKNRRTHCQMDKRICVKKKTLQKLGIYKLRDVVSHRPKVIFAKDIYNFTMWGKTILYFDMNSKESRLVLSNTTFIKSGLCDYCLEHLK